MRALLTYRRMFDEVMERLNRAAGAVDRDFERVVSKSQAAVNRLAESWDRATEAIGGYIARIGGARGLQWVADKLEQHADAQDQQRKTAPKTIEEFRQRYADGEDERRLADLDRSIVVAERDVDAAVATAKVSKLGRDPRDARAKLERLRTEREMLRLNMAARKIEIPAPPAFTEAELQAIRDSQPRNLPLPAADPRKRGVPFPLSDPRRSALPPYGSIDNMPQRVVERIRSTTAAAAAPVEATLKGSADVNVKVTVEPAPDFWTRVKSTVTNAIINLRINAGAPETGTTGSLGRSMPDIGPRP